MREPDTQRKPYILKRGEGRSVWSLGGRFTMKVTEDDSRRQFALVEAVAFRTTEPPLHIDHHEDEAWYILDGQMTFYARRRRSILRNSRETALGPTSRDASPVMRSRGSSMLS